MEYQWHNQSGLRSNIYPSPVHTPVQLAGGPMVYVSELPEPDYRPSLRKYPRRTSMILGVVQLLCGICSIILGGISFPLDTVMAIAASGFWVGGVGVVTGLLGILTYFRNSTVLLGFLIFSAVLSVIASVGGIIADSFAIFFDNDPNLLEKYLGTGEIEEYNRTKRPGILALDSLLLIFAVIIGLTAIWSCSIAFHFCCKCRCCAKCCCPWLSEEKAPGQYYNSHGVTMTKPQIYATPHYPDGKINYYQPTHPNVYSRPPQCQHYRNY